MDTNFSFHKRQSKANNILIDSYKACKSLFKNKYVNETYYHLI